MKPRKGVFDGSFVIADDCIVTEEEIGPILSTTSANHFNFVAPDLASGDHKVTVLAKAMASAAFLNGAYEVGDLTQAECEADGGEWTGDNGSALSGAFTFGTADNNARAWAVVDLGSLTVEQVRATNQEGGITIDLDTGFCFDADGDRINCPQ